MVTGNIYITNVVIYRIDEAIHWLDNVQAARGAYYRKYRQIKLFIKYLLNSQVTYSFVIFCFLRAFLILMRVGGVEQFFRELKWNSHELVRDNDSVRNNGETLQFRSLRGEVWTSISEKESEWISPFPARLTSTLTDSAGRAEPARVAPGSPHLNGRYLSGSSSPGRSEAKTNFNLSINSVLRKSSVMTWNSQDKEDI